jgi:succinate-semialdehyde dehydrogenase, mitochondrial
VLDIREEVFGPVAPLVPFKTEEEAIHMANDTNAGTLIGCSALKLPFSVKKEKSFAL